MEPLQAIRNPQLRAQLLAALRVLAQMHDPGKAFDIIESWMKNPEVTVLFSEKYEPLNVLVMFARRDFQSFEKLFWRVLLTELMEHFDTPRSVKSKASRRRYQRAYMRKRRQEEKERGAPKKVEFGGGEYEELENLLGTMPDEELDAGEAGLLPGSV